MQAFLQLIRKNVKMDRYGKRLQLAMDSAKPKCTRKILAAVLGSSVQAVGMVITGTSARLDTVNHSRAASFLRVDSLWLATGDGEMKPSKAAESDTSLSPEAFKLAQWFDMIKVERSRLRAYAAAMQAIVEHLPDQHDHQPTAEQSGAGSTKTPPAKVRSQQLRG